MKNKSANELLEIIDSSSVGSFICDMEKGEIYYSYEWSKRLGIEHLSPREATLVTTTHVHPEDQDGIQMAFLQACEQKSAKIRMEFRVKTVDSGYIWVLGQGKIIYNQDGRPVKYYGTHSDITERKKTEEELQRYAEELKKREEESLQLIDSFTEGTWIVDRLEGTIKCSEKWEKRIGLDHVPEEERLSYTHTLAHTEDTLGGNSIQHYMEIGAERFDLEYRVKTVDRGYIWTQNRGKIVYNEQGEAIKVYAASFDITERKRTEEALRDSQATLKGFYNSSPFMMGVAELKDNEIIAFYGNKAVERFFHQPHNQLPGLTGSELGMPEEVNRLWIENYLRSQREGMPVCFEYQHLSQHGLVWLSATVSFIGQGVDGLPRFSFVAEEITDRKCAEEELRESERIAVDLVEKLRIADKNKNDFINMLSHELRNPLASIMMGLELLEKAPPGGKQSSMALGVAKRQGKQLTNLVDDLLDVTRITQDKVALKKETVEINDLIDKAVQDYRSQFIAKNVKAAMIQLQSLYRMKLSAGRC